MDTASSRPAGRSIICDRYELAAEIGRGATGTVWDAWDRKTAHPVAIKILHPSLLTSELTRKRFLREVELASTLRHPHCVQVLAHHYDEHGAYVVMERLAGTTFATHLRQSGPLSQPEA